MQLGNAARTLRVLTVLTVAIPVASFAISAWLSWDEHFTSARDQLMRAAAVNREHAIKVFETMELVAAQIGESLRGRSDEDIRANEAAIHRQLTAFNNRFDQIQDIWVIAAGGRPLASASSLPVPGQFDASDQDYMRLFRDQQLDATRAHISEVRRGETTGRPYFQITRMRPRDGSDGFNGVTAIRVDPAYFERYYREAAGDRFAAMGLTREDGTLLARYPATSTPLDRVPRSDNFARAVRDRPERRFIEAVSPIEGVARINAIQRLADHPVYVTVSIDRGAVVRDWRLAMARYLVFGVPATLALFALTLIALRFTQQGNLTLANLRREVARREAAEEQLRQAQKMEAVGRLTGGVAHDFNNLLTIVGGNLEMLKRRLTDPDPRVAAAIENAMTGVSRAAKLTHRLLAFSRQQPLEPVSVDIHQLVASMAELLRSTLGETIAIEAVLARGLWRAKVDPNELENAILNLAINARDAMPRGGKITLETANAHLDADHAQAHEQVSAGDYVMIAISDTGTGMTSEVMAKAFEPFFTTKPVGMGTGLGLSQVYGFIKQSGGHVALTSEVGRGTTVKLYLPKERKEAEEPRLKPAAASAPVATEAAAHKILVVEDDAMVRQFSVEVLEAVGHRVLAAADGPSALTLLRRHPDISLLFTDVVLGGAMDGRQLADESLKIRPTLKVLFTTGHTRHAIVHDGRLDEGVNLLGKPFSVAALTAKVQKILGD